VQAALTTLWVQVAQEREPYQRPATVGFALPRDLDP